ncbi:TIR domain-containing protein [Pseudomonas paralactis]|uniref:Nucleic acid-binding protein n=1 Tax=Pseudomonas paralactis TaxID=1615673 RepID=A0A0R3AW68_9PSED|nr:nucleotide-binding protein [Pseudomonas paralactis]KRP74955.1 nucleic acid-binding protein [Pseudomonas paralactis]
MATKRVTQQTTPMPLKLIQPRDEAKNRLGERIEKGLELKQRKVDTREAYDLLLRDYQKWDAFNKELLKQLFSTDELAKEYSHYGVAVISMRESSLGEKIADAFKKVDNKIHRIDSIIERIELIPIDETKASDLSTQNHIPSEKQPRTKKVFVVHGRDEISKTSLEVFLHEIGLEPVVLHRQADEGMTIIEKFEKHSDVGYVFILLTPDEIAYLVAEEEKPDSERNKEFRARPNVIFEFGYFIGKFGRSRVCCLYTGNVSLPSDVNGIIYKKFDKSIEEVAYSVIKDLKASGYTIS